MILYGIVKKNSGFMVEVCTITSKFTVGLYWESNSVYMTRALQDAYWVLNNKSCFCNDTKEETTMNNGDYEVVVFKVEKQ